MSAKVGARWGLGGWLGIVRVVLVAIGKKQNECLFSIY